jgi:hypothetical protein
MQNDELVRSGKLPNGLILIFFPTRSWKKCWQRERFPKMPNSGVVVFLFYYKIPCYDNSINKYRRIVRISKSHKYSQEIVIRMLFHSFKTNI